MRPACAAGFAGDDWQVGQVRKNWPDPGWLARFHFRVKGEKHSFHGPLRASKSEAETDRETVAAAMAQGPQSSRVEIASHVLQSHCLAAMAHALPALCLYLMQPVAAR